MVYSKIEERHVCPEVNVVSLGEKGDSVSWGNNIFFLREKEADMSK